MRTPLNLLCVALAAAAVVSVPGAIAVRAQAPAAAPSPAPNALSRTIGTVKTIAPGSLTVGTDKGESISVALPATVKVMQLAPGSTDLKTAQPATVADIAEGDRVLVAGRPGDGGAVTAVRVVLMKGSAIAQNNEARQQDWARRGSGGMVDAVNGAAGTLTITSGTHKETVTTTPTTVFRRYAAGSVKFEDAKVGKLDEIHAGDQVRVRGDKSADGASVAADEVVSGAFRNLAGTIKQVNAAANTVTLTDLATKKPVTVSFTADSDLRSLPPEMAARFAARARGGAAGAAAGARPAYTPPSPASATSGAPAPGGARGAGMGYGGAGGAARQGGGDLSQVIGRLPKETLADLKPGEAVMVVASGDTTPTAITLLSGVEPLLTASPQGGNSFTLSPWNMGGGEAAEAGGGSQ